MIAEFVLDSTLTEDRRPDFLMAHYPGALVGSLVTESGVKVVPGTVSDDNAHPPSPTYRGPNCESRESSSNPRPNHFATVRHSCSNLCPKLRSECSAKDDT